jgi:alkaline phosphatase
MIKCLNIFLLTVVVVSLLLIVALELNLYKQVTVKKNVILMISDGFGPASQVLARNYLQFAKKQSDLILPLDTILVGSSRTKSSSSFITDSAAGATAFSCGLKV